jgi:hypothetical protein
MKQELRELGLVGKPWQPKVGDLVDVADLRHPGAIVDRGAKVLRIFQDAVPGQGKRAYAELDTGYSCSTRCLLKHHKKRRTE